MSPDNEDNPDKADSHESQKQDNGNPQNETCTGKQIVGLVEEVKVIGKNIITAKAVMDTGATGTSVDIKVASAAELGPIVGTVRVKSKTSADGYMRRIRVRANIGIMGKIIPATVNVVDRKNMTTPILIGRDILHSNFIVDVEKTHKTNKIRDEKDSEN